MTNVHTEWHSAPLSTTARHTCWRPWLTDTASWVRVRWNKLKMLRWTVMNYGLVIGGQKASNSINSTCYRIFRAWSNSGKKPIRILTEKLRCEDNYFAISPAKYIIVYIHLPGHTVGRSLWFFHIRTSQSLTDILQSLVHLLFTLWNSEVPERHVNYWTCIQKKTFLNLCCYLEAGRDIFL